MQMIGVTFSQSIFISLTTITATTTLDRTQKETVTYLHDTISNSLSLSLFLSLSLLLRFFLSHSLFSIGATTAVVQKLWQGITKHLGLKVKNGFVFLIKHTVHLNLVKGMLCKLRESVFCRLHKLWWVTLSNVVLWVCCCSLISLRPDPNNYHLALVLPFF